MSGSLLYIDAKGVRSTEINACSTGYLALDIKDANGNFLRIWCDEDFLKTLQSSINAHFNEERP